MLKVPMNPDIKEFEPKIYGMTKRQIAYAFITGAVFIPPFTKVSETLSFGMRMTVIISVMLVALAFGKIKLFGMTPGQYLLHVIKNFVLTPRKRVYETETWIRSFDDKTEEYRPEPLKKMTWKEKIAHKKDIKKYKGIRA